MEKMDPTERYLEIDPCASTTSDLG